MIIANCQSIYFCPFKAEAALIAANLSNCRKINAQTWSANQTMIFTWNGVGFLPMQKFLDCFPVEELREKNIFLFGSAGSVDDNHQPGQIFTLNKIKFENEVFDAKPADGFDSILALTKDSPIMSTILRQNIFEKYGSCLIDQESFHFLDYFKKHEIEARVIRFVSDTPSHPFKLPFSKDLTARFSREWKKAGQNRLGPL
jgi:hypothetical protein